MPAVAVRWLRHAFRSSRFPAVASISDGDRVVVEKVLLRTSAAAVVVDVAVDVVHDAVVVKYCFTSAG